MSDVQPTPASPEPETERKIFRREIKSFVRREGRITTSQQEALDTLWPRYGLDAPKHPYDLSVVFGRVAPVVFEIGFGAGDALLHRAHASPERDFVGVEVHRPGVGRVLNRAEKLGLTNLKVVCHDAVEVLRDWLSPGSLAEVIVEFPDPWHKSRHHKRRIIQTPFINIVASRLQAGGLLRLATDWVPYGEHMIEVLNAHPQLQNCAPDGRTVARPDTRPVTRFEARGERLGHEVFDLLYQLR